VFPGLWLNVESQESGNLRRDIIKLYINFQQLIAARKMAFQVLLKTRSLGTPDFPHCLYVIDPVKVHTSFQQCTVLLIRCGAVVDPAIKPLIDRPVIVNKPGIGVIVIDRPEKLVTFKTKSLTEVSKIAKDAVTLLIAVKNFPLGSRIPDHCKGQSPIIMLDFPEAAFPKKMFQGSGACLVETQDNDGARSLIKTIGESV